MILTLVVSVGEARESTETETDAARNRPKPAPTTEEFAQRGLRDAQRDLANGKIELRGSGLAPHHVDPKNPETMYKELLHERTGLRLVNGGCVTSPSSTVYDRAYNGEVKSWVRNKFGSDVFARTRRDSRKAYEEYREEKRRKAKELREKPLSANEYEIQPGDTFYAIAKRHGCSVQALLDANEALDPRRLQVRQKIILPASHK